MSLDWLTWAATLAHGPHVPLIPGAPVEVASFTQLSLALDNDQSSGCLLPSCYLCEDLFFYVEQSGQVLSSICLNGPTSKVLWQLYWDVTMPVVWIPMDQFHTLCPDWYAERWWHLVLSVYTSLRMHEDVLENPHSHLISVNILRTTWEHSQIWIKN